MSLHALPSAPRPVPSNVFGLHPAIYSAHLRLQLAHARLQRVHVRLRHAGGAGRRGGQGRALQLLALALLCGERKGRGAG